LLQIIHQQRTGRTREETRNTSEVLQTWLYNWQTKERHIPEAMVESAKAIQLIESAFQHLNTFHDNFNRASRDLQPDAMLALDKLAFKIIKSHSEIIRELEEKINAIRLYWFPETVEHFKLGAYKSVRQFVQDLIIDADDLKNLVCSTCLEPMAAVHGAETLSTATRNSGGHVERPPVDPLMDIVPVIFKRRCEFNPLLQRRCDLAPCRCVLPSICLNCALDHILKNGIHEGKSSVRCPACRGEVCIYDVQEINLVVRDSDKIRELTRLVKKLRDQLQNADSANNSADFKK
jgi:hypothetical protein